MTSLIDCREIFMTYLLMTHSLVGRAAEAKKRARIEIQPRFKIQYPMKKP